MKRFVFFALALAATGLTGIGHALALPNNSAGGDVAQAQAARHETVSFDIDNMTCAMCPVTARTAMNRVEGVQSVAVDFDAKTATVAFDPAVTTADDIAAASTNAGYPAHRQDEAGE